MGRVLYVDSTMDEFRSVDSINKVCAGVIIVDLDYSTHTYRRRSGKKNTSPGQQLSGWVHLFKTK